MRYGRPKCRSPIYHDHYGMPQIAWGETVFERPESEPEFIGLYWPNGDPIIRYPYPKDRIGFDLGWKGDDDE